MEASLQPTRIINNAALRGSGGGDGALDKLSEAYAAFGLRGPITRGLATGGIVYALIMITKPNLWFYPNGVKKPWSVTSDREDAVLLSPEIVASLVALLAAGF